MRRRGFPAAFATVVATITAPISHTWAQKAVPRVAYVYIFKQGPTAPFFEAFTGRMRELGWIDGQNVRIEPRDANGSQDRLSEIMRELVDSRVDVIVAMCTPEARVARRFTSSIPIVMAATGDPVAAGLVQSMANPGGNITGVSSMTVELSAKRLDLLKAAFPAVTRATIFWNPDRPDNTPEVNAMVDAGLKLGVQVQSRPVRTASELSTELDLMPAGATQAVLNAGDPMIGGQARRLVEFAAQRRLPALYEERSFVDAGGLMSYGPNFPRQHRRAADYVDKILKGAKPGSLPMEQPTTFELIINLRTAKALGFNIPQSLLVSADEIIQ
jgi:putative ABC transport system substrate-binding protein